MSEMDVALDEKPLTPDEVEALRPGFPRWAVWTTTIVLLALIAGAAVRIVGRVQRGRVLAVAAQQAAIPSVAVIHPQAEAPNEELVLPGTMQAFQESPLYARTNGYLVHWYKDIGSQVRKGELLAQIDTPEVDQELLQARATRQQVQAQLELARTSAERWQSLRKSDSVSQQEADQQSSAYQQSLANLAAADASVRRLEQMESFKNVYAPFSGVLTKRNVDNGALINAGANGREMFDIAQVDPLRVFLAVPQTYSQAIRRGMDAVVTLQEFPTQQFHGTVVRTSDAIDPVTRMLLTEVDVPNHDGRLLPGSYAQVQLATGSNVRKMTIPVSAMLFRREGPRVAVVGPGSKVQLRNISIGRDYGSTLEIVGGLELGDEVISNPADSLEDGQPVQVASTVEGASH